MFVLIKNELKKLVFKKSVVIIWLLGVFFCSRIVGFDSDYPNYVLENYASLFNKAYLVAPFMAIVMFTILSPSYSEEYTSNMTSLINSSKNGGKNIVIAKGVAASIATTITTLSMYFAIVFSAVHSSQFKELDTPLKSLWYFGNSGSNITVLEMIIISSITIALGCIFFSQVTLFLSSLSDNAVMPFIVGGLIMGLPWLLTNFLPRSIQKFSGLTPLWGMFSFQLVRYKSPTIVIPILLLILALSVTILPIITYKQFVKEER